MAVIKFGDASGKAIYGGFLWGQEVPVSPNQLYGFWSFDHQPNWKTGTPVINGIEAGKPCIPVINRPDFNPTMDIIHNRKAMGLATHHTEEYLQGKLLPNSLWEYDANCYNLALPLWTLFQTGASEDGGTKIKTYEDYNSSYSLDNNNNPIVDTSLTLLKKVYDMGSNPSTAKYQRIVGAICNNLTLRHNSDNNLKTSTSFYGYDYEGDYTILGDTINFSTKDPLKFGYVVNLGGTEINVSSWEINISNNALLKYSTSQNPDSIVFRDITVEGNILLPTSSINKKDEMDDFINGNDKLLNIYWGTSTATNAGELSIKTNIRYSGLQYNIADGELFADISFIGVYDGTNKSISILLNDNILRGI